MQLEYKNKGFVPLLSSSTGATLTFQNLQRAGIKAVSYHLADLLMKPGLSVLNNLDSFRDYCQWPGELIIDASLTPPNQEGIYKVRSLYDGSIIQITLPSLFEVITHLKPDKILLPLGSAAFFTEFWQRLPPETMPYFHIKDIFIEKGYAKGTYLTFEPSLSFPLFLQTVNESPDSLYIKGDFDAAQMQQLLTTNHFIASEQPIRDGVNGVLYINNGIITILDSAMRDDYQIIDADCCCQTCEEGYTRAYLHHLLQQTPLLAQRYLAQHNCHALSNFSFNSKRQNS